VADFDAALDFQGALAVRARVAFDDVAQVGDGGTGRSRSQFTPK
jgi:hypothetical protein